MTPFLRKKKIVKIAAGQVAVITGGAGGIGFGLAEALAARGVRLVLADIREEALESAADALWSSGAEVIFVRTDVSDGDAVERLAVRTLEQFGRVDLLCNSASLLCPDAPLWKQNPQAWDRMLAVKLMGVIHGVRSFAPIMITQGSGHILNTASSGGLAPLAHRTPYAAAMHAVVGLTESLAIELGEEGPALGATVLCPGLVDPGSGQDVLPPGAFIRLPGAAGRVSMRSMAAASGGLLTALEVAEAAIVGIEEGLVHVAPGHDVLSRARQRIKALMSDLERSEQVSETGYLQNAKDNS
ncbi:SDR family NAD(P)-dependent oxidoreductase [Arthrobacter sp. HS15c]|uniref:SDR family NAD(P)-dependent oxidoreductase n=1 Tax=Arthrobacter sp. HS15c TaxID=3230279 RepID=UPI003464F3AA